MGDILVQSMWAGKPFFVMHALFYVDQNGTKKCPRHGPKPFLTSLGLDRTVVDNMEGISTSEQGSYETCVPLSTEVVESGRCKKNQQKWTAVRLDTGAISMSCGERRRWKDQMFVFRLLW